MRLTDLINSYKADFFSHFKDESLNKSIEGWMHHSSVSINGVIAVGWLQNDDIMVIGSDGIFVYDIQKKGIVFEDYETELKHNISHNNLIYFLENRNEKVNIFGLRGGGGNLLTKDRWHLDIINLTWNIKVPRILKYYTQKSFYIELIVPSYESYLYLGFSESENFFLIMGDSGIDIYSRV
jgi:hypothetical protein